MNKIIADIVKIDGTFRAFDEEWRKQALQKIKDISTAIASLMGAICDVNIASGYPFLVNDDAFTQSNISAAKAYM